MRPGNSRHEARTLLAPNSTNYKIAAVAGLFFYVCATSTLTTNIIMSQKFDDALFIRLGLNLAEGHWLGLYNELTLVKGPIYPLFLAFNAFTGFPINITQFTLYYIASMYISYVISRIANSMLVGLIVFVLLLLNPSLYVDDLRRVIRTVFYVSILYVLIASWIDLYLLYPTKARRYGLAIGSGICLAAVWMTREEGFIVISTLLIVFVSGVLLVSKDQIRKERINTAFVHLALALGSAVAVFCIVATLNFFNYGRFAVDEMKDGDFQSALIALQRVGGVFDRPYVPVPREARKAIYPESPAFSSLQRFLDPPRGGARFVSSADICKMLPSTCNDIAGGWFLWALRDAAARAGMHGSAQQAASFYRQLASQVNTACATHKVRCLAWIPPLVPPIPASQWAIFPSNLLRGLLLLAYIPTPQFVQGQSDLEAPDGAAAVEFLNRPLQYTDPSAEPRSRIWLRSAWLFVVQASIPIIRLIIAIGGISLLFSVLIRRRALLSDPAFWGLTALLSLSATQIFVLALVHVSSFPTLWHERTVIAEPFLVSAAVLAIHLAYKSLVAQVPSVG